MISSSSPQPRIVAIHDAAGHCCIDLDNPLQPRVRSCYAFWMLSSWIVGTLCFVYLITSEDTQRLWPAFPALVALLVSVFCCSALRCHPFTRRLPNSLNPQLPFALPYTARNYAAFGSLNAS
jgi:hypothetical protein